MIPKWVVYTDGPPILADFLAASGHGPNLCVDRTSGEVYWLNGVTPTVITSGGGGSGTVTSVSITSANGVSGSVANPTTTPAIELTLGAITPTSIAASGTVTGSNLSGTNTGDQVNIPGNAVTASALQVPQNFSITGKATAAAVSFNGTSAVNLNITAVSLIAGDIPNIAQSQVTSLTTDLAAKQPLDTQLTNLSGLAYTGNALKVLRVNAAETDWELATPSGGGGGSFTLTTVEVNLGAKAHTGGKFTLSGVGMTPGKPVLMQQAAAAYTNKGTLEDEAEMEQVTVSAVVSSSTLITCYWRSTGPMLGNVKFNYAIGA